MIIVIVVSVQHSVPPDTGGVYSVTAALSFTTTLLTGIEPSTTDVRRCLIKLPH